MVNTKKIIFKASIISFLILMLMNIHLSSAQRLKKVKNKNVMKFGFIQSKKILKRMPEYQEAKKEADTLLYLWKKQYQFKKDSIAQDKKQYQSIRLSLPIEEREKIEKKISDGEKYVQTFKTEVFSSQGKYFNKKQELMQVPLDKLFKAADEVANDLNINVLFDKDKDKYIIYINSDHDYSDYVLDKLGLGDGIDTIH